MYKNNNNMAFSIIAILLSVSALTFSFIQEPLNGTNGINGINGTNGTNGLMDCNFFIDTFKNSTNTYYKSIRGNDSLIIDVSTNASYVYNNALLFANSGTVFINYGYYYFTSGIFINHTSTSLISNSGDSPVLNLANNANCDLITFGAGAGGNLLSNLYLNGNKANQISESNGIVFNSGVGNNGHLENLDIVSFNGSGIKGNTIYAWIFKNIYSETNFLNGITFNQAGNCIFSSLYIYSNIGDGLDGGYQDSIIETSFIYNNLRGIDFYTGKDNTIINNLDIWSNRDCGLICADIDNIIITNNHIYNNSKEGIHLQGCDFADISHNNLFDNGIISNNSRSQIKLNSYSLDYSEHCKVSFNNIYETQTKLCLYGIEESNNSQDYNILIGNDVSGSGTANIHLLGSNSKQNLNYDGNIWVI